MRMRTKCDKHVYHIVHKFMQIGINNLLAELI